MGHWSSCPIIAQHLERTPAFFFFFFKSLVILKWQLVLQLNLKCLHLFMRSLWTDNLPHLPYALMYLWPQPAENMWGDHLRLCLWYDIAISVHPFLWHAPVSIQCILYFLARQSATSGSEPYTHSQKALLSKPLCGSRYVKLLLSSPISAARPPWSTFIETIVNINKNEYSKHKILQYCNL